MRHFTSTTQRQPDGSVTVTWPRKPAADDQRITQIGFLPIADGPIVTVNALRERSLDEIGPFGVTTWGYRIPPAEVDRATRYAQSLTRDSRPAYADAPVSPSSGTPRSR